MHGVGQKSLACFGYCLVSFCVLGSLKTTCFPSNPFLSCCGLVIECDGEKYLTPVVLFLYSFIHRGIYIYRFDLLFFLVSSSAFSICCSFWCIVFFDRAIWWVVFRPCVVITVYRLLAWTSAMISQSFLFFRRIGPPSNGEPAVAVSSCTDAGRC